MSTSFFDKLNFNLAPNDSYDEILNLFHNRVNREPPNAYEIMYIFPYPIKVDNIPLQCIIQKLYIMLSSIKNLRFKYYPDTYAFDIEYKIVPSHFELSLNPIQENFLNIYKLCGLYACKKAQEMFPHNISNYPDVDIDIDFDVDINDTYNFTLKKKKWVFCQLKIYNGEKDKKKDGSILLEWNRLSGSRYTSGYIKKQIVNIFSEANQLWLRRSAYINMVYGIETEKNTPIINYLFDELIVKDICSYL
jgi:hypothetical protein